MSSWLEDEPHSIYLAYNAAGQCIYVGMTHDWTQRERGHWNATLWWNEVVSVDVWVDVVATRAEARALERRTIYDLKPIHNSRDAVHRIKPCVMAEDDRCAEDTLYTGRCRHDPPRSPHSRFVRDARLTPSLADTA